MRNQRCLMITVMKRCSFINKQFEYACSESVANENVQNQPLQDDSTAGISQSMTIKNKYEDNTKYQSDAKNKFDYLKGLITILRKIKEAELDTISKKFDDLESKMVNNFLNMETINDRIAKRIKEDKSIIDSSKVAKNMFLYCKNEPYHDENYTQQNL